MSQKIRYTVWVGGTEVNDSYLKSSEEAEELANKYREEGYDDVRIFEMGIDNMSHFADILDTTEKGLIDYILKKSVDK